MPPGPVAMGRLRPAWRQRLLQPDLLDQPAVALGIAERQERVVAGPLRVWARRLTAFLEVVHLADVHTPAGELGPGGLDIRDHQVQALNGAVRARVAHERD